VDESTLDASSRDASTPGVSGNATSIDASFEDPSTDPSSFGEARSTVAAPSSTEGPSAPASFAEASPPLPFSVLEDPPHPNAQEIVAATTKEHKYRTVIARFVSHHPPNRQS
jgi:hypothetical protein